MVGVVADVPVDDAHGVAELDGCRRGVRGDERPQESVVDLGLEDRHALPVAGEVVGVGASAAGDQAVGS